MIASYAVSVRATRCLVFLAPQHRPWVGKRRVPLALHLACALPAGQALCCHAPNLSIPCALVTETPSMLWQRKLWSSPMLRSLGWSLLHQVDAIMAKVPISLSIVPTHLGVGGGAMGAWISRLESSQMQTTL